MERFNSVRIEMRITHRIEGEPEQVFPLFCPVREYEWLEGWECDLLYTETGRVENNCVFMTELPERGRGTWLVSRYELENFLVEYVIFYPELYTEKIDIKVKTNNDDGTSNVYWRRTYTGLTPQGNEFIKEHTGEPLRKRMNFIYQSLNHYVKTGERLEQKVKGKG